MPLALRAGARGAALARALRWRCRLRWAVRRPAGGGGYTIGAGANVTLARVF